MAKSIALRNYSGDNPGLRLVGAVIPGTRNFNQAVGRLFTLACVIGLVAGAQHLLGGEWKSLFNLRGLVAILGLTFAFAMHDVGFNSALSGMVSGLIGSHKHDAEFNEHIRIWTRRSAHMFLLINALHSWATIGASVPQFLQSLTPAVYGYFYATFLGIVLRTQARRENEKMVIVDYVLPVAFMALCYVIYTRWI